MINASPMANQPALNQMMGIGTSGIQDRLTGQQSNDAQMARLMGQIQYEQGANQLQANTSLANTNTQANSQIQQANIAADAAKYPTTIRQQEFNQLFPIYSQGMGTLNNLASSGFATTGAGGTGGAAGQPTINAAPVWNPQQVNRQVNQSNAQQDQATATQQRTNQQQAGGRGYSSSSPLLAELNQSAQMGGQATKAANAQNIRYGAAQGNSQQLLQGQQAQEQQYGNRQQEALKRQQNVYGLAGSFIGGLSSALA